MSTRVLVVDDNAENRALAQATLEDEGMTVVLAKTGEEGIEAFAREKPDCVLLDVRMPGMGGVVACEKMRALPGGADTPIIFVTAQRDVETFDRARLAGGDDFITKPFRPSELVLRVQAAAKLRRIAVERTELYELIRKQRDDVMRLSLQREQLIAFLVHDLKNPVHAIDLHAERIARDAAGGERSRDAAAKIRTETHGLLRMITNLLDLSKADEGQLTPKRERIELAPLVDEVLAAMRVRAQTSHVQLASAIELDALEADRDLVRRVLENLIDNAIRHSPEGGTVTISARRIGDASELRVADAGSGVPAELRDRVFDRFVQNATTSATNRGLGLAFCKVAIEAQGGRIWIEDAAPGAVFCLSLG